MSLPLRILVVWLVILLLGVAAFVFLPHREQLDLIGAAQYVVMILIAIIAYHIARSEFNPNNKAIFVNFVVFFGSVVISYLYYFIGRTIFTDSPYAAFYFFQYFSSGFFYFILAFSLVYVVVDTLFNDIRIYQKYLVTFLILGGVFAYYYHPILTNPKYLYTIDDVRDYKTISSAFKELKEKNGKEPAAAEISQAVSLYAWRDGKQIGTLFDDHKLLRVSELLPYVEGNNWVVLLYRPLHLNVISLNVLCIVFIFLFYGYQYKKDPPQGAYIEKIVFLFLPYCSLEILHAFAYYKTVEMSWYYEAYSIGQYLTLLNFLMLLGFFSLRLRFITSVKGEFYEQELVSDSQHISRWRDGIDNLVVRHFLNPKTLHGRLLAPRASRAKT